MKKIFFCLIIFLFLLSFVSTETIYLNNKKDSFPLTLSLNNAHLGILVVDADTRDTILSYSPKKHFIPASNIKLYTYFLLKENLNNDSIIGLKYKIIRDTLFVKPNIDPTFLNADFVEQKIFDFLHNSTLPIVYQISSREQNYSYGSGWQIDDVGRNYLPEITPTPPIFANSIEIIPHEKTVVPPFFKLQIRYDTLSNRSLNANKFKIDSLKEKVRMKFIPNDSLFVQLLQDTLKKKITIKNKLDTLDYKTLYSHPADTIYKEILLESDNFVSEYMIKYAQSQGSFSTTVSTKEIFDFYFQELPTKAQIVDASGLSRYNLTSPENTVYILQKIFESDYYTRTLNILPEAGKTGTLKKLFLKKNINFSGKTGTLKNNYNLSGYLRTKNQKTYIVSIMLNNYIGDQELMKKEVTRIIYFLNDFL